VLASVKIDDVPIIRGDLGRQAAEARARLKDAQSQLDKLLKESKPAADATEEALDDEEVDVIVGAESIDLLQLFLKNMVSSRFLSTTLELEFFMETLSMEILTNGTPWLLLI